MMMNRISTFAVFASVVTAVTALSVLPARAEEEQVLCPDTEAMKKAVPGDISGVQADIERLNLCVERAKLLKALDDVVVQRQQILQKITAPTDMMPTGGVSTGLGMIPPLPVGAMPPLPGDKSGTANLKPGELRVIGPGATPVLDKAAEVAPDWQIRKIWGQGAGMRAQIADKGTGTLLNVIKGDPMPDGSVVETVSVKGVSVSRNGKINDLSWEQSTESSPSSNAKVVP